MEKGTFDDVPAFETARAVKIADMPVAGPVIPDLETGEQFKIRFFVMPPAFSRRRYSVPVRNQHVET